MARGIIVVILRYFCLFVCSKYVIAVEYCSKIDSCTCETDEGTISLRELGRLDGKPRFRVPVTQSTSSHAEVSWNPCFPYSMQDECTDVAGCAVIPDYHHRYAIAYHSSVICARENDGKCSLKYRGGSYGRKTFYLTVSLNCDEMDFEEGRLETMHVSKSTQRVVEFKGNLYSKYACARSPQPTTSPPLPTSQPPDDPSHSSSDAHSPDHSTGLSLGSKLLISFFSILLAYIVIGTLFNKYARHIQGKEAFPNYTFWIELPVLVKDGGTFTFHSVKRVCGRKSDGGGYAPL